MLSPMLPPPLPEHKVTTILGVGVRGWRDGQIGVVLGDNPCKNKEARGRGARGRDRQKRVPSSPQVRMLKY